MHLLQSTITIFRLKKQYDSQIRVWWVDGEAIQGFESKYYCIRVSDTASAASFLSVASGLSALLP